MNKVIQLKSTRLPKMLGELMHSNQFLKLFALASVGVAALLSISVSVLATRPPIVLALTSKGSTLDITEMPKPEDEIQAAVKKYIDSRYNWEPSSVAVKLKSTESFILPQSVKAFQTAIANIIRFSTEKQVSQKTYPDIIKINLQQKTASITGDRITSVQGLRAAGSLKLELSFESGARTKENPWGIYITKEKEEQ